MKLNHGLCVVVINTQTATAVKILMVAHIVGIRRSDIATRCFEV